VFGVWKSYLLFFEFELFILKLLEFAGPLPEHQ